MGNIFFIRSISKLSKNTYYECIMNSRLKSLAWYISRLSKMSPREILHRVEHKIAEKLDKVRLQKVPPPCPYSVGPALSPNLFKLHVASRAELATIRDRHGMNLPAMADAILANRVNVFGIAHDFLEKIDWHLDVKTGCRWPLHFWADINIRNGFTIGGPKFVWETNRLHALHILGLTYRQSGEERYAAKFFSLLEDWLTANPYPLGVNWTSGIELGTRIANLIWGISALAGRPVSERETELVNRFVWLHGRHLYRYPSKYSSNNNHAIAEAFALFLIGVYFPEFNEAKGWLTFGREVLNCEGKRQILSDGGSYEYTTTYLSFVFDFFFLYKLVCERNKIDYEPIIDQRLKQSCLFIQALMDSEGNIPNIGDQDSAILLDFGIDNLTNFKSILNTGAISLNNLEFKQDDFPDFKTKVLLADKISFVKDGNKVGASRISNYHPCDRKQENTDLQATSYKLFRESGLAVIRGKLHNKDVVFVGNATPLGMPPLYAHGHLDALSFTLSVEGLQFMVDPGTYLYHSGGKWRRYFRSTAAHNTIRVNETDMTEQVADFMFGKPYRITEHSVQDKDGRIIWQAGHDAYLNMDPPVSHVRQVIFERGSKKFVVIDLLDSKGSSLIEQYFHFHPECSVVLAGNTATISRGPVKVEMSCDQRLRFELIKGSHDPLLGWYSQAFNHITESYSLVGRGNAAGKMKLRTTVTIRR